MNLIPTFLRNSKESVSDDGLENFINNVRKKIFGKTNISIENQNYLLLEVRNAYIFSQLQLLHKFRNNGDKYHDHAVETALIILNKFENPNIKKIITALLHDIIEDTEVTFNTIKESFGQDIAIAVQTLSKEKVRINNESDKKIIEESGILDDNGELREGIKENEKIGYLDEDKKNALKIYLKYKKIRNLQYLNSFKSINSVLKLVNKVAKERGIKLSAEKLYEISLIVIDVKLGDRSNNLETQWDPNNIELVERKIEETEIYLLKLAQNFNKIAYDLLCHWINTLRDNIFELKLQDNKTPDKISNLLTRTA